LKKRKNNEEIKDLDKIEPIDYGVVAKPHTPIYKMHRYFARRPYTVFSELIKHYSNPGSIILDPMCGGGVTIVEGLKLGRKVIGVDLNPMAIFITRYEVMDMDLDKLKKVFYEISDKVKDEINGFYLTKCPQCKKETPVDWFEYSYIIKCTKCKTEVLLAKAKKVAHGRYLCEKCKTILNPIDCKKQTDVLIRVKLNCICGHKEIRAPISYDIDLQDRINKNFTSLIRRKQLWFPKDEIPPSIKIDKWAVRTRGFTHFYKFFTLRNLLALSILHKVIGEIENKDLRDLYFLTFSSMLYECACYLCHIKNNTVVKPGHHFWIPNVFASNNVWKHFERRFASILRGKQSLRKEFSNNTKLVDVYNKIKTNGTCILWDTSSTNLSLPSNSIDCIITDPPYGDNVNYSELSNFWVVWLRESLGITDFIDNTEEAIVNAMQKKSLKEYRNLLHSIFKECYRVLKPNRWMVMTFHNRNFKIWNALQLAAHDAGFIWSEKDGMIYQPPIQAYITTLHQQASGSMLGDFILSYKKAEKPPKEKWIEEVEVGKKIREIAGQAIIYHGGAKLSTIYMRVMPFLLNSGLLEKIKETDLESYLRKDFAKRDEKWYIKELVDEKTGSLLDKTIEEYAPVKARLESIVRRFLAKGRTAAMDEILQVVYSRLINSNAAEYEEIVHVLSRICVKVKGEKGKELWQLKEERDKGLLFKTVKEKIEYKYSEESDHDIIIEQLVKFGKKMDYESHIGLTEQKKDKNFRELSIPMGSNVQFGLPEIAFNRIREIDVLWVKDISILAAFEIEKSTTIDSGITRFRELFAATHTLNIPTYIVIPDKREKEAKEKIGSLANRRDGLTRRIKYILFSDLFDKSEIDITKIGKEIV